MNDKEKKEEEGQGEGQEEKRRRVGKGERKEEKWEGETETEKEGEKKKKEEEEESVKKRRRWREEGEGERQIRKDCNVKGVRTEWSWKEEDLKVEGISPHPCLGLVYRLGREFEKNKHFTLLLAQRHRRRSMR